MKTLFFGTYDRRRHPRVTVLIEGCRRCGDEVAECNAPLGDTTGDRVAVLHRPWRAIGLAARIGAAWYRLFTQARSEGRPDRIVVGYLGHLDVHLARRLWPDVPIVLDHLISLGDTAADRGASSRILRWVLNCTDRAALRAADLALVDTDEQRDRVAPEFRRRTVVAEVGAPIAWFVPPRQRPSRRLRVVFFGLFTPLQGAETIARAVGALRDAPIEFTMIGTGQDYERARSHASSNANVTWTDWIEAEDLPRVVSTHDVCLGIFGTSPKAVRVVPNKVYQGAAAGCAIVTSDTAPQRRALGPAAVFVPAGSEADLAESLVELAGSPRRVWQLREASFEWARSRFTPEAVVAPLRNEIPALRSTRADRE